MQSHVAHHGILASQWSPCWPLAWFQRGQSQWCSKWHIVLPCHEEYVHKHLNSLQSLGTKINTLHTVYWVVAAVLLEQHPFICACAESIQLGSVIDSSTHYGKRSLHELKRAVQQRSKKKISEYYLCNQLQDNLPTCTYCCWGIKLYHLQRRMFSGLTESNWNRIPSR